MSSRNTAEIIQLPPTAVSKRVETVKRVRAAVEKKTRYLLEGLSSNVADALFEEMHHLSEEDALACHFNIMRCLKTQGDVLANEFAQYMDKSWVNLVHRRDKQAIADASQDVTPMLKAYSDKYLNHYKILLEELRLRFCHLSRRRLAFHPMLPGNFYLCFWHATEDLDLTYQERKLLLPLFHRFVMDRFGQVLAISNQTLVELEIPAWFE
ncbi:MAG: DUF1631 family protein [Pseudomonadales bacterium]